MERTGAGSSGGACNGGGEGSGGVFHDVIADGSARELWSSESTSTPAEERGALLGGAL
jgi:hypothetical protein